jgi:signal transduction histidine kinase
MRPGSIGLSLVKRITDRFDWQISIESELSRGTRVTLTIPAAEVIALDERLPEPRLRA